jgi:hypothetical protein
MNEEQAICPECNLPCGPAKPGAKVYHWSCLMKRFEGHRNEQRQDFSLIPGPALEIWEFCHRCANLTSKIERETLLCPLCVSREEEC